MKLLQRYIFSQTAAPALLCLSALALLALLTQSLQTLDLIVENRQSAGTFFYITVLALPQLIGIILPLAVFMASLYALNRLNSDSELVVAKANGVSPWSMGTPMLRLGVYALILHLIINLLLQPLSFREMRSEILKVRTDIASQMVQPGEFVTPTPGLTVYARNIGKNGLLQDVVIHDARNPDQVTTHTAKTGELQRSSTATALLLRDGALQSPLDDGNIDVIAFEVYQLDLSDVMAMDAVLRLKSSDRFLHELLRPNPNESITKAKRREFAAEGHARLAAPLYTPALVLLALCFMLRGEHQKLGYGRKIAVCAVTGFSLRLVGFALTSAAESSPSLNVAQYVLPLSCAALCLAYLLRRRRRTRRKGAVQRYDAARLAMTAP